MVTQSKWSSGNGRRSASAWTKCDVAGDAGVGEALAPDREHRGVDVGHDVTVPGARTDPRREARRQVAGAAGQVEHRCPARTPHCSMAKRFHTGARRATSGRSSRRTCRHRVNTRPTSRPSPLREPRGNPKWVVSRRSSRS
jgi:hypothetical protein